jgi:sulfide:quinone oxidoreductase
MTAPAGSGDPLRVVVAGGGLAAQELLPALRALAGDRVAVTVVTPDPADAFTVLASQTRAKVLDDALAWVDPVSEVVHTEAGQALPYDAFVVAIGARTVAHAPRALSIDPRCTDAALDDLLREIVAGTVHSAAFVVPERAAWAPALYDLALDAAAGARENELEPRLTLVTAEDQPLAHLGPGVTAATTDALEDAGIAVVTRAHALVPGPGQVVVPALRLTVKADRIFTVGELLGPAVRGLPGGAHGFLPVDPYGRVRGVRDIYAAGDTTDHPVKTGDVASRQADTVARTIAARAGADVVPVPFRAPPPRAPVPLRRGRMARIGADDVRVSGPAPGADARARMPSGYLTAFLRDRAAVQPRRPASGPPASPTRWSPAP